MLTRIDVDTASFWHQMPAGFNTYVAELTCVKNLTLHCQLVFKESTFGTIFNLTCDDRLYVGHSESFANGLITLFGGMLGTYAIPV